MEEDDKDVHTTIYKMKYRAIDLSTAERSSVWFGFISQSSLRLPGLPEGCWFASLLVCWFARFASESRSERGERLLL